MAQRLEQVIRSHDETLTAEDARETLREMCRNLSVLLGKVQGTAQRVAMVVGSVSVEVEWAATVGQPIPAAQPVPMPAPVLGSPVPATPTPEQVGVPVRSPLVGTFYGAPEPGARPFAVVGDIVEAGQQVGIVEAMKLMNSIEAPCRGRVVELAVADGESVEYDQPLLVLDPVEAE